MEISTSPSEHIPLARRCVPLHIGDTTIGMRGLTILFATFAALLMMRGQHQPNFVLLPTAPKPAVNVPRTAWLDRT